MIIRGGYNVYPREIEEVLLTHPDVSLAAVIGVPHESHGEEIKAVVIRKDGADRHRGRAGRVGQGADGRPTSTRASSQFVDDLPMTATGKILKRELSADARPAPRARRSLMILVGALWTFQGLGYVGGSAMTDQTVWAIIGPIVAGLGVALVFSAVRRPH